MKHAYIILAHKNPEQLHKLLQKLKEDNDAFFFIHIDRKSNIEAFNKLKDFESNVTFTKRFNSRWGQWGIVEATLNAMNEIKASNIQFDYIHLLSGQDYPIRSNKEINAFLSKSSYKIFMETYGELPIQRWENGGLNRVNYYYFGPENLNKLLAKSLHFLMLFIPFIRKRQPSELKLYGGSQWWSMDLYALNFLLRYVSEHPKIISYFRHSFAPDELFFQTVFNNATDKKIQSGILNNNMRFMDFPSGQPSPEILALGHKDGISKSDAFFARKFDLKLTPEIFDVIDEVVCKRNV